MLSQAKILSSAKAVVERDPQRNVYGSSRSVRNCYSSCDAESSRGHGWISLDSTELPNMKTTVSTLTAPEIDCTALVVFVFEDGSIVGSSALQVAVGELVARLVANLEFDGKLGKSAMIYAPTSIQAHSLLLVGAGKPDKFDCGAAFRAGGAALKRLADRARTQVAIELTNVNDSLVASILTGALNGAIGQDLYRREKNLKCIDELICCGASTSAIERGSAIGESMLLTRELVNLPPNMMYPEVFVQRAVEVAVSCGLEFEIWDELRLRKENCNALLGVNAGSVRPPRLLILRYPGRRQSAPVALVGKGVTFDSGGLSLKPTESMTTMKCDMAGAATVLGTMQAIARLKLVSPVVGLVGLVENMVSGNCLKLGDVLTARSGKTIEILNTDAEGRLVLADVLDVCLQEKPTAIVDLATLTGACMVALGGDVAGLMGNRVELTKQISAAAAVVGELVWELPMFPHYSEQIQSQIADIKNVGEGRWGGAITAAKFLEEFVGDTPWTHIDIAGPAFAERSKSYIDAGGTGCMVRTLTQWIESL